MKQQITLSGIVLLTSLVGDYDKRVVILTKERGKITAFARNARKTGNTLMAVCQPFNFGQFTLFEGRDAYTLSSANIENFFTELKSDLDSIYFGTYFCEFADYFGQDNNDCREMMKLLYVSLRALENKKISNGLIRYIFEIKLLYLEGTGIDAFECGRCHKKEKLIAFSKSRTYVVCDSCHINSDDEIVISQSTLYALQFIVSSKIEKLYTFVVSDEVLMELEVISKTLCSENTDKRFKSLEIIETMKI